jgi:H+/Cl- antiporter ClcA
VPPLDAHSPFLEHGDIVVWAIALGAVFGLVALLLIETLRGFDRLAKSCARRPYLLAAAGGLFLAAFYRLAGETYAGLGTGTIEAALTGTAAFGLAFLFKILATAVTLETGGSGGIVTPIFFIGATSGAALGHLAGLPGGVVAAFGFVSVLAAAANTPIAAAVMGMELLPGHIGVYAALSAGTAFLLSGHRSVYASQKLGFTKSAGLEVPLDVPMGDVSRTAVRIRKGTFTEIVHRTVSRRRGGGDE